MKALGRLANLAYAAAEATKPARHELSDSVKARPSIGSGEGDAAAAVIRNARRAEMSNTYENLGSAKSAVARVKMLRDFIAALKEKLAAINELFEQIASGRFSRKRLAENLQKQAQAISSGSDALWGDVWAAIRQAQSDSASPFAGFERDDILALEEKIAKQNANSELGILSLARLREKALRALRCQEDLDPERVLSLLKDELTEAGASPH